MQKIIAKVYVKIIRKGDTHNSQGRFNMKFNTKNYLDSIGARVEITEGEIKVYQYSKRYKRDINKPIYVNIKRHPYGKDKTYLIVTFWDAERNKTTSYALSRLVYLYFIGDIPAGYDVDHIDGDTFNNLPENLQLLTRKENLAKRECAGNQHKNSLINP